MNGVPTLILFIAGVLTATIVGGTIIEIADDGRNAAETQGDEYISKFNEDIEIISDTGSDGIYDSGTDELTIYVLNTGVKPINESSLLLQVNGGITSIDSATVRNGGVFSEDKVAVLKATESLTGQVRVKVSTIDGNKDSIRFNAGG